VTTAPQWPFSKWNLYDAGIGTPFLAAWPGVIRPGSRSDAMVQWIDLLPTLIEFAGGKSPEGIDGRSFADVLRGQRTTHREVIYTTHSGDGNMNVYPIRALRTPDWKYILNLHPEFAHTTHIDQGAGAGDGWRYFREWVWSAKTDAGAAAVVQRYHQRPREELYDLRADPHEQRNLAADPQHARAAGRNAGAARSLDEGPGRPSHGLHQPRLLSDPSSYAPVVDEPPAAAPKKKARKGKGV